MDFKIVKHSNYTDLNGKQYFRYKIFFKGRGFWISSSEFANYPDYVNVQGDIITLKEPIEQFFAVKIQENKNGKFNVLIPKPIKEEIDDINALKSKLSENFEEKVIKEPEVLYQISENKVNISPLSMVFKSEKTNRPQTENPIKKNVRQQFPEKAKSIDKTIKVADNTAKNSNKLSFVNNLLDYSVKNKVDEKTRERLFSLIGREIENSGELKEVIARIEKLENELKPTKQESVEEKFELDLSAHQPLNLVNFIDKFRDSHGIKYLTHKFEVPGQIFSREEILEIAKKEFWDFVKNNPIYSRFYNCFRVFAFGGYDYKNHKGEIVKKTEWSFNRTKYSLNWKSQKIEIWCSENPGMHPIEKFEDDLIKPFQLTYKIENGILKEYLIDRLAKALGNTYSNFDIEIIDFEKANFKTDVDSLLSGISGILNSIKQREIQSRKIKIVFERKGRTRFIKIIHVGSKSIKSFEEEEHDLLQGDLLNVKRSLFCVCDWSIVSENPSNKINQINILYDIKLKKAKESIDDPIEGFTHILTFYS